MHAMNMQLTVVVGRIGLCISPRGSRSKTDDNYFRQTGVDFEPQNFTIV